MAQAPGSDPGLQNLETIAWELWRQAQYHTMPSLSVFLWSGTLCA